MSDTREMRPEARKLANEALACFRDAGINRARGPAEHCCIGDIEGRYNWWLQMGDSMTLSGMTFPLSTVISPCDKHLPEFERMWPE